MPTYDHRIGQHWFWIEMDLLEWMDFLFGILPCWNKIQAKDLLARNWWNSSLFWKRWRIYDMLQQTLWSQSLSSRFQPSRSVSFDNWVPEVEMEIFALFSTTGSSPTCFYISQLEVSATEAEVSCSISGGQLAASKDLSHYTAITGLDPLWSGLLKVLVDSVFVRS